MNFGSLFSGIGGLDLGLERAGMTSRWQVEIDGTCNRVLEKHWPRVKRYKDVFSLQTEELERVDLICGGFPCQPVSHALGERSLGRKDARWLWPQFARIVRDLRPRYILIENTPGLRWSKGAFGEVLFDLASFGYDAEWESISAHSVGAPHLRERVFIVAYPNSTMEAERGQPQNDSQEGTSEGTISRGGQGDTRRKKSIQLPGSDRGASSVFRLPPRTSDAWTVEPSIRRVVDGVPDWVDRMRMLGNAVVPQVAEWVGRRILESEGTTS